MSGLREALDALHGIAHWCSIDGRPDMCSPVDASGFSWPCDTGKILAAHSATPLMDPAVVDAARARELADLRGEVARLQGLLDARPAPVGVTLTDAEIRSAGLSEYSHEKVRDRYDADLLMAGFADGIRWLAARQAPTVALDREAVAQAIIDHSYNYDLDECMCGSRVDMAGHVTRAVLAADPRRTEAQVKAEALREAADQIDRGPALPLPPSVFSALVRERADRIGGDQ